MSTFYDQSFEDVAQASKAGAVERAFTLASGSLLVLPVLGKRTALRWTAAAAGASLIYCGVSGTRSASRLVANIPAQRQYRHSITIGKSPDELFALWRNTDVLTRVMRPFGDVLAIGPDHIRWCLDLPVGRFESEALLAEERSGELVHWQTVPSSRLQIDEYMRFKPAPQGRGTEASLEYIFDFSHVPAGQMFSALSAFFETAPRAAMRKILRNFKSFAESGEIPSLERNPSARSSRNHRKGDLV